MAAVTRSACAVGRPDDTRAGSQTPQQHKSWVPRRMNEKVSAGPLLRGRPRPSTSTPRSSDHLAHHYSLCPCSCTECNQSFALIHVCERGLPIIQHISRKRKAFTTFCITLVVAFPNLWIYTYIWNTLPSQEVCLFSEHFKVCDWILIQACICLFNVIPSIFAQNTNHQAILYTFIFLLNI